MDNFSSPARPPSGSDIYRPSPIPFRSAFDARLAQSGPPAVFIVDAEGELRLDPFKTRDGWSRLSSDMSPAFHPCHCLYRDRATGYVQYVLVTSPSLYLDHPRAQVRRYPDQAAALRALQALPHPPIVLNPWDEAAVSALGSA